MTTIRPALTRDLPAVVTMGLALLTETRYGTLLPGVTSADVVRFVDLVWTLGGEVLLAEVDGTIQGGIVVVEAAHPVNRQPWAEVFAVWVHPSQRGRLGRLLIAAAEDWATAKSLPVLQLSAHVRSGLGLWYTRLGFSVMEISYTKTLDRWAKAAGNSTSASAPPGRRRPPRTAGRKPRSTPPLAGAR